MQSHPSLQDSAHGSSWTRPKAKAKKKAAKKKAAAKAKTRATKKKLVKKPARTSLTGLRREVRALERKVAKLSALVDELTTRPDRGEAVTGDLVPDPYLRWLEDPSIDRYRGRHVAIDAARGVVVDGDSLKDVIDTVRARGLSLDDVCLATVPAGPL